MIYFSVFLPDLKESLFIFTEKLQVMNKIQYRMEDYGVVWDIVSGLTGHSIAEDFDSTADARMYANDRGIKLYPFDEGDDYWTIERGQVVYSCWDDVSEELYDEDPDRLLFDSEEKAYTALERHYGFQP